MGQLVPQSIKTLFGGVSRQPVTVRRENQVEECTNAMPSIVSGGFEKRPATQYINRLTTLENRLIGSEDFDNSTYWALSGTGTIIDVSNNNVYLHPFGATVFELTDNDNSNFVTIEQNITTDAVDTEEFIFSIDIHEGTLTGGGGIITLTWDDASFAQISFLTDGTISTHGGAQYVASGVDDLGLGWFRFFVWASNTNSATTLTASVGVGLAVSDTGSICISRAQVERVDFQDQIQPSPYAYTDVGSFDRQSVPGISGEEYFVHQIDRDPTEQYILMVCEGQIHIYDTLSGEAKQVMFGDSTRYFAVDLDFTEVGAKEENHIYYAPYETEIDYTITWRNCTAATPNGVLKIYHSVDGFSWDLVHTETVSTENGSSETTETITGYSYVKVEVDTADTTGTISVKGVYKDTGYLYAGNPVPEDFDAVSVADHTFLCNKNVVVRLGGVGNPDYTSILGTYQKFSSVPAASSTNLGKLAHITGDDVDKFSGYWVVSIQEGSDYYWEETASPYINNVFDPSTMPIEIIREATGRFTVASAPWGSRPAGDEDSNPPPSFVGSTLSSIFFYRGRLGVLSNESVILSRLDDIFSWFAEKATEVLNTDPIDRVSGTEKITLLKYAVPFRKLLFITADTMQFELSATDVLTPETAALDPSTSYTASPYCRPALMGDTLYFSAQRPGGSTVFEYYFDEDTLTNSAVDVTKHIGDYIEGDIIQMRADPVTGTLFALATGNNAALYVYRTFWDDENKVMSSWFKYTFGDESTTFIHGFAIFSGYLVLVYETPDGIFMDQMTIEQETAHSGLGYAPLLDNRTEIYGIYDSVFDETTWYSPWLPSSDTTQVVLGADFDDAGLTLLTSIDGYAITASGDYSAHPVYVGNKYTMSVELSKIFLRDQDNSAILEGTLKLRDITFSHQTTGYYKVEVSPTFRDTYTYEFTGYIVGDSQTLIGEQPLQTGTFKVPVKTDAKTVTITITNDTQLPCVITSASWRGFFSEISRR